MCVRLQVNITLFEPKLLHQEHGDSYPYSMESCEIMHWESPFWNDKALYKLKVMLLRSLNTRCPSLWIPKKPRHAIRCGPLTQPDPRSVLCSAMVRSVLCLYSVWRWTWAGSRRTRLRFVLFCASRPLEWCISQDGRAAVTNNKSRLA